MSDLRDLVGRWLYFSHTMPTFPPSNTGWTIPGVVTARGFTVYRTEVNLSMSRSASQAFPNYVSWRVGVRIGTTGFEGLDLPTDELKYTLWETGAFGTPTAGWDPEGRNAAVNSAVESVRLRSDAIYSGQSPEVLRVLASWNSATPTNQGTASMEVRGRVFVAEN